MDSSGYMIERATPTRMKARAGDEAGALDDAAFRLFYQQHARAVWSYLCRVLGNPSQADDVLQETFCRFLTAPVAGLEASEQRAYVFRIAVNLASDHWLRRRRERTMMEQVDRPAAGDHGGKTTALGLDMSRTFSELKPQERALL